MGEALSRFVLKLNKNYHPLAAVTCKNAMKKLCAGKAVVLDARDASYQMYDLYKWIDVGSGDFSIKTEHFVIPVPEIIVESDTNYVPQYGLKWSKKKVKARDNFTCSYCGIKLSAKDLTVDHIHPKSKGGKNTFLNTAAACQECNGKKSNKLLSELPNVKLKKDPTIPAVSIAHNVPVSKFCESWNCFFKKT